MGTKKRKSYSEEFKRDAVKLLTDENYTLKEASEALGVSQHSLSNWRHKFSGHTVDKDLEKENRRLRKELERVNQEREILKKALGYFAAEDQK